MMQWVQVGCWFFINLGGNRLLQHIGDWMKYPIYFVNLSWNVLIPLVSIAHWIYNYETMLLEENNLIKAQLLTYPLMGISLICLWPLMTLFMSQSYEQHLVEERTAFSGSYSIRAIVDKLDDDDELVIKGVCKHACIFDLKAGRKVIHSKKRNSKSKGFPVITDEELENAL